MIIDCHFFIDDYRITVPEWRHPEPGATIASLVRYALEVIRETRQDSDIEWHWIFTCAVDWEEDVAIRTSAVGTATVHRRSLVEHQS